jgi:hypothetical protein
MHECTLLFAAIHVFWLPDYQHGYGYYEKGEEVKHAPKLSLNERQ